MISLHQRQVGAVKSLYELFNLNVIAQWLSMWEEQFSNAFIVKIIDYRN